MAIKRLTVQGVKALSASGKYHDGDGLYLYISKDLNKRWVFRYQHAGRRREMGLGALKNVTLAAAREKTRAAKEILALGQDPIAAKALARKHLENVIESAAAPPVHTFKDCAAQLITFKQAEWKNRKHAKQWTATLETYAYPVIGDKDVASITQDDVLAILTPIWLSKNETAGRVRGRIESVLGWAKVKGLRTGDNPAAWRDNLEYLLPKPSKVKKVQNQPRLKYQDIPAFVAVLARSHTVAATALLVMVLTALRSSEVRCGRLGEVDFKAAAWAIPPDRVKAPIKQAGTAMAHTVPVSSVLKVLLKRFTKGAGPDSALFPGLGNNDFISETAIRKLILQYTDKFGHFTMHGMRSSFKDWAMECSDLADKDLLSEAQLGHKLGSSVKIAYMRTNLLDARAALMQDWLVFAVSQVPAADLRAMGVSEAVIKKQGLGLPAAVSVLPRARSTNQ